MWANGLPKPVFSPCPRVGPWTQGSPPTTGSITSRTRSPGVARSSQRERLVRPIGPGRRSPVQPDTFSVCYRNPAGPAFAGPASYSRFQEGAVSTPLHRLLCHQPPPAPRDLHETLACTYFESTTKTRPRKSHTSRAQQVCSEFWGLRGARRAGACRATGKRS